MSGDDRQVVLRGTGLRKTYKVQRSLFGGSKDLHALRDVDLELHAGETLGVVGESGCGKSTLARLLVARERPTAGSLEMLGEPVAAMSRRRRQQVRQEVQMVHQDPSTSLNPRMPIGTSIREPLDVQGVLDPAARSRRVSELMEQVGLNPDQAIRRPNRLSGGQRQRVDIARALALNPKILVCDEPVSALDVSVQAQIVNLLARLQDELGIAMVFISHDLSVVQHVADRVMVMYLGEVVERGPCQDVYADTLHPYAAALLAAAPSADRAARGRASDDLLLTGDPPSPLHPPSGCSFRTRCWKAEDRCAREAPTLTDGAHEAACFFPLTTSPQASTSSKSAR